MNDIVPTTNVLAKQGVTAVGGVVGGIVLLILGHLPSIFGIVAGALVGVIGLGAMGSKEPTDRRAGLIATIAGGLTILSKVPFLSGIAGGLLGIATVGLLGMGIWNGIKFFRGLKKRG
jgi:hypothetical protein